MRQAIGLSVLRGLLYGLAMGLWPYQSNTAMAVSGWTVVGLLLGALLTRMQRHPRRVLGFVPLGGIGLTIVLIVALSSNGPELLLTILFGLVLGLIIAPLSTLWLLPGDLLFTFLTAASVLMCMALGIAPEVLFWFFTATAAMLTLVALWRFRRELVELLLEIPFFVFYRFRAAGPGLSQVPPKGPLIVIANHSAYLDPLWLGKVIPRTLIPMMTSVFFDRWFLRWIMVYLVDAIRVQKSGFRREVPELQDAVAALDAGKCLVVFPEGRLRRTAEKPLKMFGQGVWHILKQRPHTPVVICWIEGGWGSYFSYYNGPPTMNKPFDWRHEIAIAVGAPRAVPAEVLADHQRTRQYLMEECLQMRRYLGLEPFALASLEANPAEVDHAE